METCAWLTTSQRIAGSLESIPEDDVVVVWLESTQSHQEKAMQAWTSAAGDGSAKVSRRRKRLQKLLHAKEDLKRLRESVVPCETLGTSYDVFILAAIVLFVLIYLHKFP